MLAFARRINPPENEIPAAVATSALLARTDDVAIALIGAHAYTFGLRFDLVIRLRHEPRGAMAHKAYVLLSAYSGREDSDERLLLGVHYADGRTATNFQSPGFRGVPANDDPDEPVVVADGLWAAGAFVRSVVLADATASCRPAGRCLRLVRLRSREANLLLGKCCASLGRLHRLVR